MTKKVILCKNIISSLRENEFYAEYLAENVSKTKNYFAVNALGVWDTSWPNVISDYLRTSWMSQYFKKKIKLVVLRAILKSRLFLYGFNKITFFDL